MSIILQANNIVKDYNNHRALDDVSIEIPEGAIYGLMGPNGAGKTTLIRIINRITMPDSGEILFNGKKLAPQDVLNIGYLPEERGLYKKMKVGEQALYLARLKGLSRSEALHRLKLWFKRFEILGWWDKKVEELSKGMAQKIQFIVTVIHNPALMIFDEPFSGFDPINANLLKNEILDRAKEGATVIFSTHNMSSVEEICSHLTLINKSHNVLSGSVDDVRRSYGTNDYLINFKGDTENVKNALAQLCTIENGKEIKNLNSLVIVPNNGASVRDIIEVANRTVDIHSFSEIIPSMNDIFIRAVENSSNPVLTK